MDGQPDIHSSERNGHHVQDPEDITVDDEDVQDSDDEESDKDDREQDAPLGGGDYLTSCPRCTMRVRRSELDIHLAHAHNWAQGRKPQRRRRD